VFVVVDVSRLEDAGLGIERFLFLEEEVLHLEPQGPDDGLWGATGEAVNQDAVVRELDRKGRVPVVVRGAQGHPRSLRNLPHSFQAGKEFFDSHRSSFRPIGRAKQKREGLSGPSLLPFHLFRDILLHGITS